MRLKSGRIVRDGFSLAFAGGSHQGKRRKHNEDSFALLPESGVFCVADGVGALARGAEAADRLITYIVKAAYDQKQAKKWRKSICGFESLRQVVAMANRDLYVCGREKNIHMATTLVALQFADRQVSLDYVGDSRAYLYRQQHLSLLSRDHSLQYEHKVNSCALKIEAQSKEHMITRAIGCFPEVQLDSRVFAFTPGDFFLLCSDGLTNMVPDSVIVKVLRQYPANSEAIVHSLIALANDNGGRDNITVIAVSVDGEIWS